MGKLSCGIASAMCAQMYYELVLVVLLLGLGSGCRTAKVLYRDPEFTSASVRSGGLAIGGVTPTELARGYMEQDRLANMVQDALQNRWPGSPIIGPDAVRAILGINRWQRIMDSYFTNCMLNLEAVDLLRPLAPTSRYFLLVELRLNDVDRSQRAGLDSDTTWDYDPLTGWTETSGSYFFFASSKSVRRVWCFFLIYDLQTGRPVWLASARARGAAGNYERSYYRPVSVSPMGPPATSDLMTRIIRRTARKLPGPG